VILTDPYLTDYAAPFPGVFFKRFVPPGISIKSLPKIDLILISHNHYDHLDEKTIEQLPNKEDTQVIVPLGLGEFFTSRGYEKVEELNWHDKWEGYGLKITGLPAIHFSRRNLFDLNRTLWLSFGIFGNGKSIYFSGDTAHGPVFKEIGENYGPFDHAIIAIAAYEPKFLMKKVHVTPEDAIKLAKDINAKKVIGMHWGTVILTDEPVFEPPVRFMEAGVQAGYDEENLWLMKIGETRGIKGSSAENRK